MKLIKTLTPPIKALNIVFILTASWCASAFAGGELADPAVGGDWNADATWSDGVRPQAGEAVVVKPTADAKVTLSADDSTDYKSLTFYSSSAKDKAASIEFDGNGKTLVMPHSDAGNYDTKPFVFLDGEGKDILYVNDANLSEGDKAKAAPVRLTNAHFKLSQTADGSSTFVLDRGKMDFCTDAGDASANREVYLAHGLAKTLTVAITNATIEVPKFFSAWNGTGLSYVFDHATFISHGYAKLAVDNGYYHRNCDIVAKDSTFDFQGGACFGRGESKVFENCIITGGAIDPRWTHSTVFRNCTMNLTGCMDQGQDTADQWESVFNLTFDGGTYAFGESAVGGGGGLRATMTITGGASVEYLQPYKTSAPWGATIGGRGTGVVEVVSGSLQTPARNYAGLFIGKWADQYGVGLGRLVVSGGKVDVGAGPSANETDGLVVGGQGQGEVHISGGEIRAPRLSVGFDVVGERISGEALDARLAMTSFVHQTGGRIDLGIFQNPQYACFGVSSYSGAAGGNYDDRDTKQRAAYYFDGGELEAGRLFGGMGSKCRGGTGYSLLSADGGTFRVVMPRGNWTTLTGFDRCEVGCKGLTIDSNGYEVKVEQDIVNKEGAAGRLVKMGPGTLLYDGNLTAADLIVSGGVWQVASGSVSSHVTLAPGAIFSTAGDATDVTVAGLSLTNATLQLDPGDVITVNGPVAWDGLIVQFTSAPTKDEARSFLRVQGELGEDALAALRRAFLNVSLADGTHAKFDTSYAEGVTTVTVTVVDDVDPIGPENTLTWIGNGSWDATSNWSPNGTPDETKKAAFTNPGAGKSVTVGSAAIAGAVTFGEDGYALVGDGSLEIAGVQGAAQVEATAGESTVAVPMAFDSIVSISVKDGAKLTLDAPVSCGGMKKSGEGELRLSCDNAFQSEVSLNGGRVSVGGDAFGHSAVSPVRFTKGILEFSAEDDGAIEIFRTIRPEAGDRPVVFDVKTDAKFPFDYTSARIFKRGVGALELTLGGGVTMNACGRMNVNDYNWTIAFDEKGNVDEEASQYMSGTLVIAEGKVRIAAKPGLASKPKISCNRCFNVGGQYAAAKASAELELDGVELNLNANSSGTLRIGSGMTASDSSNAPVPALRMKDAKISCVFYPTFGDRTTAGITPTFTMTNSTFVGRVQTYFGGVYGSASMRFEATDSQFEAGDVLLVSCGLSADVTNTVVSANDGNCGRFQFQPSYSADRCSQGYFRLASGSDFRMSAIAWNDVSPYAKNFKLVFDDAMWTVGDTNLALSRESAYPVAPTLFSVELQAGGLKLPVAAGRTFTTDCRFWGEGGVEKSGEGTLKFGPGAYQFKGPMCALAGTVDLTDAGTITNGCFGAGTGTIANGTLKDPVFRLDAGAPNLVDCTFSGRGYLDIGDEPLEQPYPTDVTLLHFNGTAPNVANWRLRGAAKKGLGAKFTVVGNEVKVTIEERGLLLLVR